MDKSLFIFLGNWSAKIVLFVAPLAVWWFLAGNPGLLLALVLIGVGAFATKGVDVLWARSAARRMARVFEGNLLSSEHELVRVDAASFEAIDLSFYDQVAEDMRALGFACLADYEDLTSSRILPNQRTFIRVFIDADGTISAMCAHLYTRGFEGQMIRWHEPAAGDLRVIELTTLMSDGAIADTNNVGHRPKLDAPPWVEVLALGPDTSVKSLLEQHRAHVSRYLAAHPSAAPVTQGRTFEDYVGHVHEDQRRRSEWRRARGGMTSGEFLRITGPKFEKPARAVVEAMEREGVLGHREAGEEKRSPSP